MEENKELCKQKIIETINKIEDTQILIYLDALINEIIEAGQ